DFTSIVINPTNPDEVIAADYSRGGVYRSTDKGYTWDRIDNELPTNRVWTLCFDPFEHDRIYAGSFSSGVYVLTIQKGSYGGASKEWAAKQLQRRVAKTQSCGSLRLGDFSFQSFAPRKDYYMKIHEYQGKALLARYDVTVPRGAVVTDPEQ